MLVDCNFKETEAMSLSFSKCTIRYSGQWISEGEEDTFV